MTLREGDGDATTWWNVVVFDAAFGRQGLLGARRAVALLEEDDLLEVFDMRGHGGRARQGQAARQAAEIVGQAAKRAGAHA